MSMKLADIIAQIETEHDHDRAEGLAWMKTSSERDAVLVWLAIQGLAEAPNLAMAVVGRFAQVGFEELFIAKMKEGS